MNSAGSAGTLAALRREKRSEGQVEGVCGLFLFVCCRVGLRQMDVGSDFREYRRFSASLCCNLCSVVIYILLQPDLLAESLLCKRL